MSPGDPATRSVFDAAASEYDAARPSYPAGLFEELEKNAGRLAGKIVLDWGAGTGIASRQLAERGATVISLDIGEQMLRRALARSPRASCVLADGSRMPVRSGSADLATFAQSWHWFDHRAAAAEVARVLRPGGYWAAWWSRARAEGETWFDAYRELVVTSCPNYLRQTGRNAEQAPDWSDPAIAAEGPMEPAGTVIVQWTREVSAADWITEDRSKSYFIELEPDRRESLLREVGRIIETEFPDGEMSVRYNTLLLLARKAG